MSAAKAPDWSAADLVQHLGQTQNWVAEILERRIIDPTQLPTEVAAMPADPQSWPDWLGESAGRAAAAASDAALEAQVFNAAGDERTGGQFWLHSLLNQAVIRGFDAAASAAGSAAVAADTYDIDADVAAELVTNHLAMLTSPTWAAQRSDSADALRGNGETLHWHATDESNSTRPATGSSNASPGCELAAPERHGRRDNPRTSWITAADLDPPRFPDRRASSTRHDRGRCRPDSTLSPALSSRGRLTTRLTRPGSAPSRQAVTCRLAAGTASATRRDQ